MKKEAFTLFNGMSSYNLIADEGKVLVRSDGMRCGQTQSLGYRYRDKDGNVLKEPIFEVPEDYSEDEMTEEEKTMYYNKAD